MKKLLMILCAVMVVFSLTACGNKQEEASVENCDVVGAWTLVHEGDEFLVIVFNEDGSGIVTNLPTEAGIAIRYEVEGNTITTHMGSEDNTTEMTYLPDSDQISYDEQLYDRTVVASVVGTWTSVHEEGADYSVLTFNEDGSGSVMNEPIDIGIPFDYAVYGTTIMSHMGSIEDQTILTYLPDGDQISYGDELYTRDAQ